MSHSRPLHFANITHGFRVFQFVLTRDVFRFSIRFEMSELFRDFPQLAPIAASLITPMPYEPLDSLDPERVQTTEEMLCKVFKVDSLRDFQVEAGQNLLKGIHTVLDAPTGAGKTLAFWYPLFYHIGDWEKKDECKKCLLLIGPLTALLKSQVKTLQEVGITAICLNAEDGNTVTEMKVQSSLYPLRLYLITSGL
jgi:hypothetical protein